MLNNYYVRLQSRRKISIAALNSSHAKELAEQDVIAMQDTEKVQAQKTTMVQENVGLGGPSGTQQLDLFEVVVRFRRNFVMAAENLVAARQYANDDVAAWEDTEDLSTIVQQVSYMNANGGYA